MGVKAVSQLGFCLGMFKVWEPQQSMSVLTVYYK